MAPPTRHSLECEHRRLCVLTECPLNIGLGIEVSTGSASAQPSARLSGTSVIDRGREEDRYGVNNLGHRKYSAGVKSIGDQHNVLFELVNELNEAMRKGQAQSATGALL